MNNSVFFAKWLIFKDALTCAFSTLLIFVHGNVEKGLLQNMHRSKFRKFICGFFCAYECREGVVWLFVVIL